MSFPLSPTDGQTTVLSGVAYSFSTGTQAWTRVAQFITATISMIVSGTAPSTSVNSGALRVAGGVGVGGSLNIGESAYIANTSYINSAEIITTATLNLYASKTIITAGTDTAVNTSTGNVTIWNTSTLQTVTGRGAATDQAIAISNNAASNSTLTGALRVIGGVGIGGNINVGGVITATNIYVGTYTVSTASALTIQYSGAVLGAAGTFNFSTGTTASLVNSVVTISTAPGQFKPNVYNAGNVSTASIDVNVTDQYNITISAPTTFVTTSSIGVPNDGQRLMIRLRGDSVARSLTWTQNATGQFRIIGIAPPTVTSINKLAYVACVYNAPDGYWDIVSYLQQP